MKIALIYGMFSSQLRGPYDIRDIKSRDLSGSESFFFSVLRGLVAAGHELDVYGFWREDVVFEGATYKAFRDQRPEHFTVEAPESYSLAVVWNEPDYLPAFPPSVKRVCFQQLNDFSYCRREGWAESMDLCFFPSKTHLAHVQRNWPMVALEKCRVLSNCLNAGKPGEVARDPKRMVYCSSPDRGLHWALDFFSEIRVRVPDATLHVFYRYQDWYERMRGLYPDELGNRARYCNAVFDRLGRKGENGLFLEGPVSTKEMSEQLQRARLLLYPCDTVAFTEGFGVAVLDACAAGALPIISDADAFAEVYTGVAHVLPGKPGSRRTEWIESTVRALTDDAFFEQVTARCKEFAKTFTPESRATELLRHLE